MKMKKILISLFCIIVFIAIAVIAFITSRAANTISLSSSEISNLITQNYKDMKDISIGIQEDFDHSLYTVYGFTDSKLTNPNINRYNIGVCSITLGNKSPSISNNNFTIFEEGIGYTKSEGYVAETNVFTELGFYDSNTDRSVIGGRINDPRVERIEITFANGEVKQPIVNDKGYFLLVYNQNKIMKSRKPYFDYIDAISSIIAYDKDNKTLKTNRYYSRQ